MDNKIIVATDHCQRHFFCSRPTFTTQQYVKKNTINDFSNCELVYLSYFVVGGGLVAGGPNQ